MASALSRFGDGAARIWDSRTGQVLATMPGHEGTVNSAVYSDDGRWVVTTADDGQIRLFESATGQLVTTYQGAGGSAEFAFFARDDQAVVSDSQGG
jgi:WD40 repeat protein